MSDTTEMMAWRLRIARGFTKLGLPDYMLEGVIDYVLFGQESGGFLMALMRGDYWQAAMTADLANRATFHAWFAFLYDYVPKPCRSSEEAVRLWMGHRGMLGPAPAAAGGA